MKGPAVDLERAQVALERDLQRLRDRPTPMPARGWVRAIRDALGMTTRELARRARVSSPRITQIEQAEIEGAITIATLERIAQALGCRLEYALVPERPLGEMVRTQAQRKAAETLAEVDHTMSLEQQRTDDEARRHTLERLTNDFVGRRGLWSDK